MRSVPNSFNLHNARILGGPDASMLPEDVLQVLARSKYKFCVTGADVPHGCEEVMSGDTDAALVPAWELPFPLPQGLDVAALVSGKATSRHRRAAGEPGSPARPFLACGGGDGARATSLEEDTLHPLFGKFAAVTRRRRPELRALLYRFDGRRGYGKVWLVGFGPGDPELMTVKADRVLRSADVIYYDSLIDSAALVRYPGQRVFVGKRKGNHAQAQETINEMLYRAALSGKTVVRLKGGDPFIFGRGGEESEYLRRRMVAVEVIPGISAALGAAAGFNLPLTKRNTSRSLTFRTAHGADNSRPDAGETQVFYMGATRLENLRRELLQSGVDPDTPVALVQNATLTNQRCVTTTVRNLAHQLMAAPVMVVVGEIVRDQHVPRTVLHTGTDASAFQSAERLIHWPMAAASPDAVTRGLELSSVDEVVFTSAEAVEVFVATYKSLPEDILFHLCGDSTRESFAQHGGELRTAVDD